jgi:hypothetical protein
VADGRRAEFARVFGLDGIWPGFLRQGPGYLVTEVRCESEAEERYRVRDFWSWHRDYETFRERYSEGLVEFERQIVDGLIEKQEFVGGYYETDEPDFGIT